MERNLILELAKKYRLENRLLENELMSKHTTYKIGGPIDYLFIPESKEEIINALKISRELGIKPFILGNGSNMIVKDLGIRGIGIKIYSNYSSIEVEGEIMTIESGAVMGKISSIAVENSLKGFEFASGIPGTIGGAVVMNAGAYGGEMKDIVKSVECVDLDGNIKEYTNKEMNFRYRDSIVKEKNLIVLNINIELKKGNKEEIQKNLRELTEKRTTKQPLNLPSCGSTFKRPEGYFAGKLIEDSGLKGYRYKNVQVSEKHCGFIVTLGDSKAEDVLYVIKHVQNKVREKFGVELETEVKIIGE